MIAAVAAALAGQASDHADAPVAGSVKRQDANLTDLHAFVVGTGADRDLVLALSVNPAIPPSATDYVFPDDVTFHLHIDNDSPVDADDPHGMGGTILEPHRVHEDLTIAVRFRSDEAPVVKFLGMGPAPSRWHFFAGLRDDPFIRGPRIGRNVASIVIQLPLAYVLADQSTLLLWATSKVEDWDGPFQDLVGRALRSMMPENQSMDSMQPMLHTLKMGVVPDVMIYDTSRPACFPNGRALTDDVVDLVGDLRVMGNDAPFPSANDVPFLATFPYLAPPHAPPPPP